MPLFPATFVDELKSHLDIVQIVGERVHLRKAGGASWKGLCPFHGEKTPSFVVHGDRQFFHCFGCGATGDVFEFAKRMDTLTFPDAVRQLAGRAGLTVPEPEDAKADAESAREREAILKVHEVAAAWFTAQLHAPVGRAALRVVGERGMTGETIELLGFGYAPNTGLRAHLLQRGFADPLLMKSGLVVPRDGGEPRDRFRNRLMIPIHRDTGTVIAFGGRAMEAGQEPKYLNSPETPIYVKGRTLYGLNWSKPAIARLKFAVLVEGYFDWAQAWQAGIQNVVASSGTALKSAQVKLLQRYASKVVLSFDPDAAGQKAAAETSELFVTEGFQVNVAVLPAGDDPDNYIRKQGAAAYQEQLRASRQYLDYLLDRSAAAENLSTDEGRRSFLGKMLAVAARIPDAAQRDQFADRLSHKARITEEVVRAEIRKAAVLRQTDVAQVERRVPALGQIKVAERGLIWGLIREPAKAMAAIAELETEDLQGLATASILGQARSLHAWEPAAIPEALFERLNEGETAVVQNIAADKRAPAEVSDCVGTLRKQRHDRERAFIQQEIDRLQESPAGRDGERLNELLRKKEALQRIGHTEGLAH
ncbi:MAG TPA: DNA primase [Vicinamibacterales bacterium]|jgi:DNA primase